MRLSSSRVWIYRAVYGINPYGGLNGSCNEAVNALLANKLNFNSERRLEMEVEVQLRTIAMDFWASLEHQLHYKTEFDGKDGLVDELRRCAETISQTDNDMMKIRSRMETFVDMPTEDEILFERIRKLDTPIE